MKKHKTIAFICLAIIIIALGIFTYKTISSSNKSKSAQEKSLSEVEFLEIKLVNLFNQMNTIEIRNYNVSVTEIAKLPSDKNNAQSSQEAEGKKVGEESETKKETEEENLSGEKTSNSNSEDSQSEKFTLKETGVLTRKQEIDWEHVKNEVEILYSSIPTITLDLYQIQVDKEDILKFNKEMDMLTMEVQNENKEGVLNRLTLLYESVSKFMNKASEDELEKAVIETKLNLFKGYSKLDSKNWQEISKDINKMIESFTKLLTDTNIEKSKQYTINKLYIMINELQNAVNVQDTNVFLIKYKNILEEMNDL